MPETLLPLLARADLILHVGDLTSRDFLEELRRLGPPLRAVRGNVDEVTVQDELPERLVVEAEGTRIGLVHDGGPRRGRHERLRAWFPGCDAVAYGHSHEPELARSDAVWILNPGSPTERRRAPTRTMIVVRAGAPELVSFGP